MSRSRHAPAAGLAAALLLAQGCAGAPATPSGPDDRRVALAAIDAGRMLEHIRILSSAELEGRAPGTAGEEKTVAYLLAELQRLGLRPGAPGGGWLQQVPLLGLRSEATAALTLGGKGIEWVHRRDFLAGAPRGEPVASVRGAELVFAGHGVVAPEHGWDDYKGADVRGKVVVLLMDDPQVPHPEHPDRYDPSMFGGAAKTWYATGRHKREMAAQRGAAAVVYVHEELHAGWPFRALAASARREDLRLRPPPAPAVAVEAFATADAARALLALAGHDLEELRRRARRRDFRPLPLGGTATLEIRSQVRELSSANVVARLEGRDPALREECVVYTAHWDHLGKDPALQGDPVFHGAADNASGVAALLEIARAYALLPAPPPRSVLFVWTTGEESGLLGARHYTAHPAVPLARTLLDLNLDVVNPWGRTRDLEVVQRGQTNLDALLDAVAAGQGKVLTGDTHPVLGAAYRQDALEFSLAGVPALYVRGGEDFVDLRERGRAQALAAAYADHYHAVTDTVRHDWNLAGAVDIARFVFAVGHEVALGHGPRPRWLPGTEWHRPPTPPAPPPAPASARTGAPPPSPPR